MKVRLCRHAREKAKTQPLGLADLNCLACLDTTSTIQAEANR